MENTTLKNIVNKLIKKNDELFMHVEQTEKVFVKENDKYKCVIFKIIIILF